MTSILISGIGELVTNDETRGPGPTGIVSDAHVVVDGDRIVEVGTGARIPDADRSIDVGGRCVLPGFVDSHTHLVFAGDRSIEFAARMRGAAYTGGGIATTVRATRAADDDALRSRLTALTREARAQGTTTLEVKSGYGLTVDDEVRLLRIARAVTDEVTFLGAHAVPEEYADAPDAYVELVCGRMLAECAPLAKWIDVFCEPRVDPGFDAERTERVLAAAAGSGLRARLHASQLGPGPGPALAVRHRAASIDHATYLTDDDIAILADASADDGSAAATE